MWEMVSKPRQQVFTSLSKVKCAYMQTRQAMHVDFHYMSSRDRLVFIVGRAMDSEAS